MGPCCTHLLSLLQVHTSPRAYGILQNVIGEDCCIEPCLFFTSILSVDGICDAIRGHKRALVFFIVMILKAFIWEWSLVLAAAVDSYVVVPLWSGHLEFLRWIWWLGTSWRLQISVLSYVVRTWGVACDLLSVARIGLCRNAICL